MFKKKKKKMNFSFSSLVLSRSLSSSPLFTSGFKNMLIQNSKFSHFSSQILRDFSGKTTIKNTDFSSFASSVVHVSKASIDQQILTSSFSSKDSFLTIIRSRFQNIVSNQGAVVYNPGTNIGTLTIHAASFNNCFSEKNSGAIFFECNAFTCTSTCFSNCGSKIGVGSVINAAAGSLIKLKSIHIHGNYANTETTDICSIVGKITFEAKGGNITNIDQKGVAIKINAETDNSLDIREFIFRNLNKTSALELIGNKECTISTVLFENINVKDSSALLFTKNQAIMILFAFFTKVEGKIVTLTSSSATFNNCKFDKTIKCNLTGLHLDNCLTSFEGPKPSIDIGYDYNNCWLPIQTIQQETTVSRSIFKLILYFIVVIIVGACLIRYIRLNFMADTAEREVLERLNVFEGEENPQIKIMLMDAREGTQLDKDEKISKEEFEEQPDDDATINL